jgi:hypothetical protein
LTQLSLNSGNETLLGTITWQELERFTTLTLTPYNASTYFNDPSYYPQYEQMCELPFPESSANGQAMGGN